MNIVGVPNYIIILSCNNPRTRFIGRLCDQRARRFQLAYSEARELGAVAGRTVYESML